ncbi:MAG TPA: proton-conducting transporter membrane subunit, partial [Thermoanaerobaculia bacterium]|nr:proton-conducting transporter membrane subunit [Thermoanaerobaculia bacterium]
MTVDVLHPEAALAIALGLPVITALTVLALASRPNARDTATMIGAAATFLASCSLVPSVRAGEGVDLRLLELFGGEWLAFHVEPLGMLFGLVASGLWLVTCVYAIGYMRAHHERALGRFFAFFAIAIGAALGVAYAANLVTLFLFYEALTFSTFPLVTHRQSDEARRAGRVYIGVLVATSTTFFLFAILWTWRLAGTTELRAGGLLPAGVADGTVTVLLLLYAFGIGKAALMPFHRWLPAAMVAPAPVSALLHAVAVVKAGVFTVLKVTTCVFGLDRLQAMGRSLLEGTTPLVLVASFTIVAASVVALQQDNLKARLAYSTIGQLSYIVLGAALATPQALLGGSLHMLTHAAGKITLFFCAGAIYLAEHKTRVSELDGIGRRMPWTMTAFLLASLSIIGLPPFGGLWSKWYLVLGALEAGRGWVVGVLVASALLNAAYLLPISLRAFFSGPCGAAGRGGEAPAACVVPLVLTAASCVALFF